MSDGQALFAVICIIYLTDCFLWLGKHSLAFVSMWGLRWKPKHPSAYLGSPNGGLVFINPFPFLGQVYTCDLLPVSFSPRGLCAYNTQCLTVDGKPQQSGLVVNYGQIKNVYCFEKNIYINNSLFVKCASHVQASCIVSIIKKISSSSENKREELIKAFLKQRQDTTNAENVFNEIESHNFNLRFFCSILFLFLFVLSPILVIRFSLTLVILPVIAITFIIGIYISIKFYKTHKILYPNEKETRITNLIKMILCPPVAIRANDIITSQALSNFSSILIAKILLKKEDFLLFAQHWLLDLKYPTRHECEDGFAMDIIAWHNSTLFNVSYECLDGMSKSEIALSLKPELLEKQSNSYCPRCLEQFQINSGGCCNCDGVELVTLNRNVNIGHKGDDVNG